MAHGPTKVLYIGGAGRSGSTLLEQLVGEIEGCFPVGELRWIWTRGVRENELCSCNLPFRSCPFWSAVMEDAFGGLGNIVEARYLEAARDLERFRYVPALHYKKLRTSDLSRRLGSYTAVLRPLYASIRRVSGCEVVVDSSKDAPYAFLLAAMPDAIDLSLLHLIRDSRAVAYSWTRKRRRPEIHDRVEYMTQFTPRQAATLWMQNNGLVDWLGHTTQPSMRLRYEDYSQDPEAAIRRVAEMLSRRVESASGADAGDRRQFHTLAGNPMRFDRGPVMVKADTEWQQGLARGDAMLVTAITAPLLARYGYPIWPRWR